MARVSGTKHTKLGKNLRFVSHTNGARPVSIRCVDVTSNSALSRQICFLDAPPPTVHYLYGGHLFYSSMMEMTHRSTICSIVQQGPISQSI